MTCRRKKVLFLIPTLAGGGAERVFSILLRHLDRGCFELHLAVLQFHGPYLEDIPDDVVLHDLHVPRVRYALPSIARVVWRVRPQTILSTLGHLNLGLILAKPLLPRSTQVFVREAVPVSAVLPEETGHPRIWRWLYRHLYKRADKVVCLSDAMVKDLAENFNVPAEKLVRIYNPIDVQRMQELSQMGPNPYSGPGPHLVAAGRMCRAKGFDILLEAMPAVRDQLPSAQLAILGEGPLRATLEQHVRRLDLRETVCFPGFQQNPWVYFQHADLFVLPSRYEALGNVLLEALALQTPVVAADCPGAIREVRAFYPGMAVVPPEDPQALAEAIVSVCRTAKPRSACGGGPPQHLSTFSLAQGVGEYSKLLMS